MALGEVMRYALFESCRKKSDSERYVNFLSCAQTILVNHGRVSPHFAGMALCCLSSDTALFGELIAMANFHQITYQVHYFQGEPLVFKSHPFD